MDWEHVTQIKLLKHWMQMARGLSEFSGYFMARVWGVSHPCHPSRCPGACLPSKCTSSTLECVDNCITGTQFQTTLIFSTRTVTVKWPRGKTLTPLFCIPGEFYLIGSPFNIIWLSSPILGPAD